jgi:hypothetical protein
VGVVPLYVSAAGIPDLDGAIFRRGHQPLRLAMERNASDVTSVTIKRQDGIRVRGLDVVELDRVVASSGEVAFIRRDAEAVDLRVWVRYRPGAYPREGFPEPGARESVQSSTRKAPPSVDEPDGMVISRCNSMLVCLQPNAQCGVRGRVPVHRITDMVSDVL